MKIKIESSRGTWCRTSRGMRYVGLAVLAAILLWIPLTVQAAPAQGDGVMTGTDAGLGGWIASLTQLWDQVKAAFGAGSTVGSSPDDGDTTTTALVGLSPSSGELYEAQPISNGTQKAPASDPVGSK